MTVSVMASRLSQYVAAYGGRLVALGAVTHDDLVLWLPKFEGLDQQTHRAAVQHMAQWLENA